MTKEDSRGSSGEPEQRVHHRKEDEKNRYYTYAIDNMVRASDELYHICVSGEDFTLCQEVISLLHKIMYEFDTFEKMLKLKHLLPLADCKDSESPITCDEILDCSKSKNISEEMTRLDKTEGCIPSSSTGINVSAPDFIPSSLNQRRGCSYTDQSVQTSWKFKNDKKKEKKLSPKENGSVDNDKSCFYIESPVQFDQNNQSVPTYINSSQEYDSNYYNNPNFAHSVVSPSVFSFHAHPYQPFSPHYIPQMSHYHLPFSLYSHDLRNSNLMHVPQVNTYAGQNSVLLHPQFRGLKQKNKLSLHYDSKQHKNSKLKKQCNETNCVEKSDEHTNSEKEIGIDNTGDTLYFSQNEKSNAKKEEEIRADNLVANMFPNEEVNIEQKREVELTLSPFENEGKLSSLNTECLPDGINENEKTNCPLREAPSKIKKKFIECDSKKPETKGLIQSDVLTESSNSFRTDVTQSSNEIKKESTPGKQFIFGLAEDECLIHFPELSSGQQKKGGRLKLNSLNMLKKNIDFEIPGTKCSESFSHVSLKLSPKDMVPCVSQIENEEKGISFSEITKTSYHIIGKQPESSAAPLHTSFKRKNKSNNWNGYYAPVKQTNSRKTEIEEWLDESCPYIIGSTENDNEDSGWEIVRTRSKWRESLDLKPTRHNFNKFSKSCAMKETKQISTNLSDVMNLEMKESSFDNKSVQNDSLNDSFSNGTYEENLLMQSELTSPELELYDENTLIDPNEMYTTYLQYLKNVKEEEVFSGTSLSELVLHPEILNDLAKETEKSQNPASLEQMTYFVNNDPIRALDFKKKLDSRIRHQEDVKKKNDAKQQLAHEKRLQFLQDKTSKLRGFVQKVEEVKAAQHQLALQRKNKLDLKLKKAEEKRKMHLNIIKRKAHDEEEKLKEIAFINELEAQNRRHDSLALRQEHEERLQCLVEERQRRLEEKAAKEAAVEERRKALEAERQEKLELMKEKRRRKEEFIDRKQQEREQERLVIAREKAREREVRLLARHTAQQATLEELQKKIQQKQEESARRHIESIELIRQKAIEIGIHRNTLDNGVPKYLNLYKPDLKGTNAHDKYKLYLKKRLKKIKSRMVQRGSIYIEDTHSNKKELTSKESLLEKIFKKLQKYEPHKIYLWEHEDCDNVDRLLDEILYFLQEEPSLKTALKDMKAFLFFDSVINTFNYANHEKVSVPSLRCILKIITICDISCIESVEVCLYFLLSNVLATLLDSLRFSLQALERPCKSWDLIVEILLRFHALVLDGLNELPETMLLTIPDFAKRMKDLISYILCSGLVNRLIDLFRPSLIDEKFIYDSLVVPSILFFKRLLSTWFISDDLTDILKSTDLLGTVPLLYEGLMKHISNGGPLPEYCLPIISLFLKLADLDLKLYQDILGAENIALQWRGIASGLMTYCVSQSNSQELLNSVIKLVGYFAIHNKENQTLLQSGKQPTVLQQLVKLPFQYFCDPEYMQELFPTLISCSYNNSTNRAIVESEIDYNGLEKFMNSEAGQKNKIIQLLLA